LGALAPFAAAKVQKKNDICKRFTNKDAKIFIFCKFLVFLLLPTAALSFNNGLEEETLFLIIIYIIFLGRRSAAI